MSATPPPARGARWLPGQRPRVRLALLLGLVLVLIAGAAMIWQLGRHATVSDYRQTRSELEQLREERRQLSRELRASRAESKDLREQLAYSERSRDIDREAQAALRSSLTALQSEVADLREQLAFYRGIVSPDEAREGLRVLDVDVRPDAQSGSWDLSLVLVQSPRRDRKLSGEIGFTVAGLQNGQEQTLRVQPLAGGDGAIDDFSFKYFEELSGRFELPDDFRPLRLTVTLKPERNSMPQVEQVFEWAKIQPVDEAGGANAQ